MKKQRKITLIALALICAICAAFAFGCSQEKVYYTVTFMDGQTQVGQPVQVEKGKRIEDLPVAERSDPNYVFDGWYKDEGLTKIWDNSNALLRTPLCGQTFYTFPQAPATLQWRI